jgi:hypothetical protein
VIISANIQSGVSGKSAVRQAWTGDSGPGPLLAARADDLDRNQEFTEGEIQSVTANAARQAKRLFREYRPKL